MRSTTPLTAAVSLCSLLMASQSFAFSDTPEIVCDTLSPDISIAANGGYLEFHTTNDRDVVSISGTKNAASITINNTCEERDLSSYQGIRFYLGAGNDSYSAHEFNMKQEVYGEDGVDFITTGPANDLLNGGADNDMLAGNGRHDELIGGEGDDALYGGDGNDDLNGDQGNDFLDGGAGSDTYTGWSGIDGRTEGGEEWGPMVPEFHTEDEYNAWRIGRNALLRKPHTGLPSGFSTNLVNTTYGAFAYVTMPDATTSYNNLTVSLQVASLNGTAIACFKSVVPTEVYQCHRWDDKNVIRISITGGNGTDIISAQYSDVTVVIKGEGGDDHIAGSPANDILEGGDGNDYIVGGRGNDIIRGGNNNDELHGNQGEDIMYGGDGHDHMWGNEHDDLMFGDGGHRDRMRGGSGNDVMKDSAGGAWSKKSRMWGESGDDILVITNGSSELYGGGGHDFLAVMDSNDDQGFYGGDGNDWLYNRGDAYPNGGGGGGYNRCFRNTDNMNDCDSLGTSTIEGITRSYGSSYYNSSGQNKGAGLMGFSNFSGSHTALDNAIKGLDDKAGGGIWLLGDPETQVLDSFWTNWRD
ncbi:calcium-binding protein [Bacterioplanoides sp.]|uniref:calcium-binding protein n=1 Tax=Bacterioplanoides sp. TaxID=2066072 RepID=UPI003B0042C5